ncbi:MAG: hypothetical protein QOK09_2098, partial [Mycobacterium sp.]|nr:hypothetical protein [Mycobacterium sp.]
MASLTSQTLTFVPATTEPPLSQDAMNSPGLRLAAVGDLVVGAGLGEPG